MLEVMTRPDLAAGGLLVVLCVIGAMVLRTILAVGDDLGLPAGAELSALRGPTRHAVDPDRTDQWTPVVSLAPDARAGRGRHARVGDYHEG